MILRDASSPDEWDRHWQHFEAAARENPAQAMRHDIVCEALAAFAPAPRVVLDVGSGTGEMLEKVSRRGLASRWLGFELSETGVKLARQRVPAATFMTVDVLAPPPEADAHQGAADVVLCCEVLEHLDEPVRFLRALHAWMTPDARLVVTVPAGPMSAFDRHIGHRAHYTASRLRNELEAGGFRPVLLRRAGFPFFNIYRVLVLLRGRRLVTDVAVEQGGKPPAKGVIALASAIFGKLFRWNLDDSPLGWQLWAVACRAPHPVTAGPGTP